MNPDLQRGLRQRAIDRLRALGAAQPTEGPPTDEEIESVLDVVLDIVTCGCLRALPAPATTAGPPHPDSVMGVIAGGGRPTREGVVRVARALLEVADLADAMVQRGEPNGAWELLRKVRETQHALANELAALLRDWRTP